MDFAYLKMQSVYSEITCGVSWTIEKIEKFLSGSRVACCVFAADELFIYLICLSKYELQSNQLGTNVTRLAIPGFVQTRALHGKLVFPIK